MLELDSPEDVRKEEVLDIKKLSNILNKNFGSSSKNLILKQYRKGFSNLTYNILWNKKEFILFYLISIERFWRLRSSSYFSAFRTPLGRQVGSRTLWATSSVTQKSIFGRKGFPQGRILDPRFAAQGLQNRILSPKVVIKSRKSRSRRASRKR